MYGRYLYGRPTIMGSTVTATAPLSSPLAAETDLRPHHVARLRAAVESTGLSPNQLADQVCDHVLGQQVTAQRMAMRPDADALRRRLHAYVRSLFTGDHDRRLRNTQQRVGSGPYAGMPLEAYLGGFVLIDDVIMDTLVHALHDDPDALSLALRSYRRVSTTDLLVHLGRSDAARDVTPR